MNHDPKMPVWVIPIVLILGLIVLAFMIDLFGFMGAIVLLDVGLVIIAIKTIEYDTRTGVSFLLASLVLASGMLWCVV